MIIAQSAQLVGGKQLKTQVSIEGGYIWSSCFHFTLVSESGFLDPGHNHYRRLISIMPLSALSPVPDFLLWSPSSHYNPTFLLSSDSVFSTKNAPKLQKQFPSMTTVLNGRWLARRLSDMSYPNVDHAFRIMTSLQQAPLN